MLFGGAFVFVTFACLSCYKREMAESQRGKSVVLTLLKAEGS